MVFDPAPQLNKDILPSSLGNTPASDPKLWGEVYTMPQTFSPPPRVSGGGKKGWLIIIFLALLLAVVGVGVYLVFFNKTSTPLPVTTEVTPPPAPPAEPAPPVVTTTPAERDRIRYADISNLQTQLKFYYTDQKKYPLAPLPLVLGMEQTRTLSSLAGLARDVQGTTYLRVVPQNPTPGGSDYLYESLDGSTYSLRFRLEEGTAGLLAGDHQATPTGFDGVVEIPITSTGPLQLEPPTLTVDTDQDGLTDAEEPLFGTDPVKPDTDADGFTDGGEIVKGFDPSQGAGVRLLTSTALATYTSQKYAYIINYPKDWLAKSTDQEDSEVIFSAGADGEFIEVLVVPNTDKVNAAVWYAKQMSGLTATDVPVVKLGGVDWVWSANGLNAYVATTNYIFTLSYNIGTRTEASYYNLFKTMISLFKLPASTAVLPVAITPLTTGAESSTGVNTNLNTNINANTPVENGQ